ncbi:MAG: dihydrolipoamide acetyltransferase family protein, partial [Candidatus Limnocylindrales bacterium]|jgi:pyruvate dehydrogenase E2 component (dihydrolipoamide acetyltransferase)
MAHPILMPKPGQMTEECTIVAWHKAEGDPVARGDILFEIETDKANMDVEAFDEGVVLRILVGAGETVPVNTVCAYVGMPGETLPDDVPAVQAPDRQAEPALATRLPAEPRETRTETADSPPSRVRSASGDAERVRISPRASQLAAASGLDPRTIIGSGPEGRITERDVRAALETASLAPSTLASAAPPDEDASWGRDEEAPRPLSRMRRVIAERLTQSATTIPHFTVTVAVDMSGLLALRKELNATGATFSVTDFILAATAQTLAEFPDVNSRTDGSLVWTRRRVHLGLAVSVPHGLLVPVIRDADRCSLSELHERAAGLAERARAGSLPLDDMSGSTFTVSNLGMFGVDEFSAIINPGEAAILAVSSVIPTPIVVGDGIGIRQVMKLTLSADHRLVDGELGARFLNALRRRLQDTEAFRREGLNG